MSNGTVRLTRAQVREIDRRSIEEYGLPGIVLMENAARGAVEAALEMVGLGARIAIVCGGGNNGGDGLAMARMLHNHKMFVKIISAWENEPTGDAGINWRIVRSMKLAVAPAAEAENILGNGKIDLIVDALFGTGLSRSPTGRAAELIGLMNRQAVPVLAVDVPSGLDCDRGIADGPCVRATTTVTFVAEKAGFVNPAAAAFTGKVVVKEIGCPYELIEAVLRT